MNSKNYENFTHFIHVSLSIYKYYHLHWIIIKNIYELEIVENLNGKEKLFTVNTIDYKTA